MGNNQMDEQERKKRLAESLLRGERTVVNSSGQVELPGETKNSSEPVIAVPSGKLA